MDLSARIAQTLAREEFRAEQSANTIRLLFFGALTVIAAVNAPTVSRQANVLNFTALGICFAYGGIVDRRIRSGGYRPSMKYFTSCLDVCMVFALLVSYASIDLPGVVFKHYVFLVLFPAIGLTLFRFDYRLTLVAGALSIVLYLCIMALFVLTGRITIVPGSYDVELFSPAVTPVGQLTKVLVLGGYVVLIARLARYSRTLFVKVVGEEVRLRSEKESLDAELLVASRVQQHLLPASTPAVPGVSIAAEIRQGRYVGGDYVDVVHLGEDAWWIVVADVSGKGIPAALVMAEVRAAVHLLAPQAIGPDELLRRINMLLLQSTGKKDFVTLFAGELSPESGRLRYVNAGHPPPLLSTATGIRTLPRRTIPLGVLEELPGLTVHTAFLAEGDRLICYTDGITERMNVGQELFGEERLSDFVQGHGGEDVGPLTAQLMDEVRRFGGGLPFEDDITILVIQRDDSSNRVGHSNNYVPA